MRNALVLAILCLVHAAGCRKAARPLKSVAVVTDAGSVAGLTSDGATLFYSSSRNGLGAVDAGARTLAGAAGADGSSAIAVDALRVYYTSGFATRSVLKTGGGVIEYVDHDNNYTRGVAVDAEHVFWGVERRTPQAHRTSAAMIRKARKAGGAAETVASMPHLYGVGILVDSDHVFFAAGEGLFRVAKQAGASPVSVAAMKSEVTSLAADESHLYFTVASFATGGGDVHRVKKSGGPVEVLAKDVKAVAVTVDAAGVYVLGRAQVMQVAKGGGTPVVLDTGLEVEAGSISVDRASIYWSDGRAVMRLAR